MVKSFRELKVWQESMNLAKAIYPILRDFPEEERFGICDQIRRAVVSIPSNIAEGAGRESSLEYARFLAIARGSLHELSTQLELSVNLGYMKKQPGLFRKTEMIGRMLTALIKKLKASPIR